MFLWLAICSGIQLKAITKIRQAPDVMVTFGRTKGDRGSYMQWKEENIAPHVVFEILSPANTLTEMNKKQVLYDRYVLKNIIYMTLIKMI